MSKYHFCIKVDNNITDIMCLPCVVAARKDVYTGEIIYEFLPDRYGTKHYAKKGDYIFFNSAKDYSILKQKIYTV